MDNVSVLEELREELKGIIDNYQRSLRYVWTKHSPTEELEEPLYQHIRKRAEYGIMIYEEALELVEYLIKEKTSK